jgi:enediyne biosynthesis thioesterase
MNRAPAYVHWHVVGFEETNLTGNVYYASHVKWQGRCREMFLHDKAATVLRELAGELRMVTLRCSCEYLEELFAFDEVAIEMRLTEIVQNRIGMSFDYYRGERLVARGEQQIACMRMAGGRLLPAAVPEALKRALEAYALAS